MHHSKFKLETSCAPNEDAKKIIANVFKNANSGYIINKKYSVIRGNDFKCIIKRVVMNSDDPTDIRFFVIQYSTINNETNKMEIVWSNECI